MHPAAVPAAGPPVPPLAASLATVDAAVSCVHIRSGTRGEPGWVRCANALRGPELFDRWRADLAGQLAEHHGPVAEQVPAGYVLQWYLGVPGYLGGMTFHHVRRVPSLAPEDVAFRLASGTFHVEGIAVLGRRFWCLPGDPDAGSPDATAVADEDALAGVLRAEVAAHAERFLQVYGPRVRFGRRTLWGAATDALDAALWVAGREHGAEASGVLDAGLVLPERIAPFTSGSTLHRIVDDAGRSQWTRQRESCCFHYKLAGVERPCVTCPRLSDADRASILAASTAEAD